MTLALKRHRFTVHQYHRMGEAGILSEDVELIGGQVILREPIGSYHAGRLDRRVKLPLYARTGIQEAWVVDLGAIRVEIHRQPTAHGYREVRVLARDGAVMPLAFPDLTIDLVDVLG